MAEKELIEKIISVKSSEVKPNKAGDKTYLEVIDQDSDRYSCWDESLWNHLGKNAGAKIQFEKKGIFRNIVSLESVAVEINQLVPQPAGEFSPQEIGMWWKEVGQWLRDGEEIEQRFADVYWSRMSEVLGIKISGVKLVREKDLPLPSEIRGMGRPKPKIEPTAAAEPQTFAEVRAWAIGHGKEFTLSWMVNSLKIPEAELRADPNGSYHKIKQLQGWTD